MDSLAVSFLERRLLSAQLKRKVGTSANEWPLFSVEFEWPNDRNWPVPAVTRTIR